MDKQLIRVTCVEKYTTIHLNNLAICKLSDELFALTNVKALFLHSNRLTSLPPEVSNWTTLQRLSLDHNQLASLPPAVQKWTALQVLYIDSSVRLPIEVIYWRSVEWIGERNQETGQWIYHNNACKIGRFLRSRVFALRFPQYYEKLRDYWTK